MSFTRLESGEHLCALLDVSPAAPRTILVVYSLHCGACAAFFGDDGALRSWVASGGHVLSLEYSALGGVKQHTRSASTGVPLASVPFTLPVRGRYLQRVALVGAVDARELEAFSVTPRRHPLVTPLAASGARVLHAALPDYELCTSARMPRVLEHVARAAARVLRDEHHADDMRSATERVTLLRVAGEDLLLAILALAPDEGLSDAALHALLRPCWSVRWGMPGSPPSISRYSAAQHT